MTSLRDAAQQALEALEQSETFVPYEGFGMARRDAERKHQAAITALRAALAEPVQTPHLFPLQSDRMRIDPVTGNVGIGTPSAEPVQGPIKWTLDGDRQCGYNNWVGETPFGRILITWKGWKTYPDACVDEFPGGFHAYGEPEEVKAACDAEFARRHGNAPPQRKPLTEEEMK